MARIQSFRAPACPANDPGSAWGERESGSADCREGDWHAPAFPQCDRLCNPEYSASHRIGYDKQRPYCRSGEKFIFPQGNGRGGMVAGNSQLVAAAEGE